MKQDGQDWGGECSVTSNNYKYLCMYLAQNVTDRLSKRNEEHEGRLQQVPRHTVSLIVRVITTPAQMY
jgi:hypothetical protein